MLRRVAAILTFAIAAFFGGYAAWFLSGVADVDLSPGGKAQMGVILALAALIFAWLGWALLKPRR
jgi:hypothetical protein